MVDICNIVRIYDIICYRLIELELIKTSYRDSYRRMKQRIEPARKI